MVTEIEVDVAQDLDAEQQARLEMFEKRLELAKRAHEKRRSEWEKFEDTYRCNDNLPADVKDLLRSKLKVAWGWQQIQTIIPRVMDPDPRLSFQPVEANDQAMVDQLKVLTKKQLNADHFVLRQFDFIEDSMVRGLGVAKVIWLQKQKMVRMIMPRDWVNEDEDEVYDELDDGRVVVWRKMIVESRPSIVWVPLEDFLPDPAATNDQNWCFVFHRIWKTPEELHQLEKEGVYQDTHLVKVSDADTKARDNETEEEAEARREGKIAVYEGWFDDQTKMVVANGILLQDVINPYYHGDIPFCAFSTQPNPRSLYGTSELEYIRELQKAVWIKDNQRIDAVNAALNLIVIADPGIKDLAKNPKMTWGRVIRAVNGQRLEQWQIGAAAHLAFQETENYLGAMQQMTGANPMLAGADPRSMNIDNTTATGVNVMQEEGNKRMAIKKLQFRLWLARIAKQMVQLNHQYLTPIELQRILGSEGYKVMISPEQIPMFLDVIPEAMSETMGQAAERNMLIELINITGQLHGTQMLDGSVFDLKPLLEMLIRSYNKDARIAFKAADEVAAQQQPAPVGGMPPAQQQPDMFDEAAFAGGVQ